MTHLPDPAVCGEAMHALMRRLFPICRSLTGDGVRETLRILRDDHLPELTLHEVPSGTECFDWTVPDEWNVRQAYLLGPDGEKIVDFRDHNLHLVGYSEPVDRELSLDDLQPHLHSLPDQPEAIPYVTSYYNRNWGFCLPHRLREALRPGTYRAVIDATLAPGHLTYGELILPGESEREVFLSTYVCHPSMANNELSGPCVSVALAEWLRTQPHRHTYRFVYIPETIGSILYLSRHLAELKAKVIAGFNLTCMGDERGWSYVPTRLGGTLADRVGLHVLEHLHPEFSRYTFLDRGSDERQYCSPGVDLPVASVMRSKFARYPEYHTSLDNLELVTPAGLAGAFEALARCLQCIEGNATWRTTVLGEPQLGKRGLYPTTSSRNSAAATRVMRNVLAYCDGTLTLLDVADTIHQPMWELLPIVDRLVQEGLLAEVDVS